MTRQATGTGTLSARRTYADRKAAGEAGNIDDEIDAWHESDFAGPLHEWLGVSWEEYAVMVTGKMPGEARA